MEGQVKKDATKGIGGKVFTAVLLSIVVLGAAIFITQDTFEEVNHTIASLNDPSEKITVLNTIYNAFGSLEREYQSTLIANPYAPTEGYIAYRDSLLRLIDSAAVSGIFSMREQIILDTVADKISAQSARLLRYRKLKQTERPLLKQNLDSLINILSADALLYDTNVVTTRRKYTTLSPGSPAAEAKKEDKRSWFQRIFTGEKVTPEPAKREPTIVEETSVRIDTVTVKKKDTAVSKAGDMIKDIERSQVYLQQSARNMEMDILQGSAGIQNYLLSLLRNVEEAELARIRIESDVAGTLMDRAVNRMYLILVIFAVLALMLLYTILSDLGRARYYRKQLVSEKLRAEELGNIKERFLANMSHEIRTPLQNILGYAEGLMRKTGHEDANVIYRSSEHLLHIVNEVLDFSRISSGKLVLHPSLVNIGQLVEEVVDSMKIQARKKNIKLLQRTEHQEEIVMADAFRIRQILYNLLGNAVKFTEEGFVLLKTSTKSIDNAILFEFEVEDTGIGMNEDELQRLFIAFEQAHTAAHSAGGTGLGLSITKELVEAYNGEIKVKSNEGEGTTISVTMSLALPEDVHTNETILQNQPKYFSALIVDDDQTILGLSKRILEEKGLDVEATTSPLEALEIIKSRRFEVVLVDYRMPEMTGSELRDRIKAIYPDQPVFAVTANSTQLSEEPEETNRFDGFLLKPFRAHELLDLLGHNLIENDIEPTEESPKQKLYAKLNSVTMGDEEMAGELIEAFVKDCREDVVVLQKAIEDKDANMLRERVHRLTGRLGFFGYDDLATLFRAAESEVVKNGYSPNLALMVENATEQLSEALDGIH